MNARLLQLHPVLAARDMAASVDFYLALGFAVLMRTVEHPQYAVLKRDDVELHLQWADPTQFVPGLDRPVYRILVSDLDGLFKSVNAAGTTPSGGSESASPWARPGNTPWGTREFHLRDPSGNGLQFYRPISG
jgi:catechol 2,3-dioxygenase-like lactoylglutathione lyase family enzyme